MFLREDWEFNVLGIYNYRKPGPLARYMDFIIENHDYIDGDVCEAGVFKGRSLLATALLLREVGSNKKVFGFDTFEGFPPVYHENDKISKLNELLKTGRISQDHYTKVQRNIEFRSLEMSEPVSASNISLSGDFSEADLTSLKRKIEFLELDNIVLLPGLFEETMTLDNDHLKHSQFLAVLLDCDLYQSYEVALPFIWKKLSHGGYIFLDEYYSLKFPGGRIAVDEFFSEKKNKPQKHKEEDGDFERWYVRKLF